MGQMRKKNSHLIKKPGGKMMIDKLGVFNLFLKRFIMLIKLVYTAEWFNGATPNLRDHVTRLSH